MAAHSQNFMKRNVKDSVFRYLFSIGEYSVLLYQTIHPEDADLRPEDVEPVTMENIMVNGRTNDLGLLVRGKLIVLIEAQSTFTLNIALRLLLYVAQYYGRYIADNSLNVYGAKSVSLPVPEFYVVYTGTDDVPDAILLSDLFLDESPTPYTLQLTVKVLRGVTKGTILNEYVRFCQIADEQRKCCADSRVAILKTIEICKRENILLAFLTKHEKEVVQIMYPIFTEKQQREMDLRDAREEGERIGYENGERVGYENGERVGYENGERVGYENGERNGREAERFSMVSNLMKTLGKGAAEVMDMLMIPASERAALNQRFTAQ